MAKTVSKDVERIRRGAEVIVRGGSIKDGLLEAGYSEATAKNGSKAVPDAMWLAIAEKGKEFGILAKQFNPDEVAATVEGRLLANTITGQDDGVGSAKLLGSMKKHKLFEADNLTGVMILQVPTLNPAGKELNAVDEHDE